jgi:predicted transcriptional regulator
LRWGAVIFDIDRKLPESRLGSGDFGIAMRLPDLRFINRKIPIIEVASALDLRLGDNGNIHCWRPELHQNGDRTASVGIRKRNNTAKCFGCAVGPLGVIDLVIEVLGLKTAGEAARWIAERFPVPELPRGKHLVQPERRIFQVGFESDLGILIRSGLWAAMSPTARAIAPVLLELAERGTEKGILTVHISYRALGRYSGVASPRAIAGALRELQEIHWLNVARTLRKPGGGPVREVSTYLITARSDELLELANQHYAKTRDDIEVERKLRAEQKSKRAAAHAYY